MDSHRSSWTTYLLGIAIMLATVPATTPALAGDDRRYSTMTADLAWGPLVVHRFEPTGCVPNRILFVFAGYDRDARAYLRRARRLARKECFIVYAPDFDRQRFPRSRYQRAGVSSRDTSVDSCMGRILDELISWAHQREAFSADSYVLFGHSAGGQMLSRVAAYCPPRGAGRIVIANPSAYVFPNLFELAPYGFGSILDLQERETRLREYLSLPITVYVGSSDQGDELLDIRAAANRQGANRYLRGLNVYSEAVQMAEKRGWPMNWRLVIADGVGHSSRAMLRARNARRAVSGQ
ncbi:MAG: hypothetical protein ACOYLQ_14845 [Hyphomicrobiaceae bacterium]